ncbi:MAG TPA: hypothetical protein VM345_09700 [Acidimicrobiales bacterium]|jgi:hypothetical protein|nr:hypothetical protein [Acidimicrobiales bacterium]
MTTPNRPAYTPPPRRSQKLRARIVGGIVLVALSALLMWVVVDLASNNPQQANLPGGDTFVVGEAKRFAQRIDEQGAPIFFKDPLTAGAGREIYVLHDGRDPEEGWYAVLAYVDPENRKLECALRWEIGDRHFVDPCTNETYDPDDERLTRYEADVNDDGKVEVDLRS